jgi:uncharacterized protein YjbI with pentapeptide repeats
MAEAARKDLEATWRYLEQQGEKMLRDAAGRPFVPTHMPNYEDEELGFSFFGRGGTLSTYSNLTLPRTYFGHSALTWLSFVNTDLSESRMCWNDFEECDFSGADLSGCDMRASTYEGCKFVGTRLHGADLRHAWFANCDFSGADLAGAIAEKGYATGCVCDFLTKTQQHTMIWHDEAGPLPPGG